MPLLPATVDRVPSNTSDEVNRRIEREMLDRVERLRAAASGSIESRLDELDREWDIERCLETGAATLTLTGSLLALTTRDRRWVWLPAGVAAFLLQHALQGWCPPLPVFRRLGVRTADEIGDERRRLLELLDARAGG